MSHLTKLLATGLVPPAPPFDPALAELQVWYKTPYGSHVNNDNLTNWLDASGNGNDATLSGGAASDSVYKTSIRNGHDVVRTINSFRRGDLGAVDFSAGGSIYFVGAMAFTSVTEGILSDPSGALSFLTFSPNMYCTLADASFAHAASAAGGTDLSNWHILSANFDTTAMTASVDGVAGATTTTALTWPNAAISIWFSNGATVAWWGDTGEILMYAPKLSPSDHAGVISYLKQRWNIA